MKFLLFVWGSWLLVFPVQAQWQWLNPYPNPYANQVVRFVDANRGFVVQSTGTLLRTDDAGQHWREERRDDNLVSVDFSRDGTGFLLNRAGVLWRSADAGATWVRVSAAPQPAPSAYYGPNPPPLQLTYARVHAISADTVVEVGANATLRRSVNGGRTWTVAQLGPDVRDISSSCFVSGRVGFVGAGGGRIYKTTDGGATWAKRSEVSYEPSAITLLYFLNSRVGFARRGYRDLLRTADGGLTWALYTHSFLEGIVDMHFANERVGLAVGEYGVMYATDSGGLSWTAVGAAATGGLYGGTQWNGVRFTSPTDAYAVGQGRQGTIVRTTDAGRTWQGLSPLVGNVLDVVFPGHGLDGYALTTNGLLKTGDGGDTWAVLPFGGSGNQLACPDARTLLVAGNSAQVHRSDDGGRTWTVAQLKPTLGTPYGVQLLSLCMVDTQTGYVSGDYNGLDQLFARTTDGGRTWQTLTSASAVGLRHLHFVSASVGFAVRYGELYTTRDGGQNWQSVNAPYFRSVADVYFVDAQVGYVIGEEGYVQKTTDGGRTWAATPLNRSRSYGSGHPAHVQFRDREVGCVQDDNGSIFRTTDGGRTWLWERDLGSQAMGYTQGGRALVLGGGGGMLVRNADIAGHVPFEGHVLTPVALTDSSALLAATLRHPACFVDSVGFEYAPAAGPGFVQAQTVAAFPVPWYGGDSVRAAVPRGLRPATAYRMRLRFTHNGARFYSADTVFTTPALVAPEPAAYPNPTTGYVRVVPPQSPPATSIEVYSLQGRHVRHGSGRGIDLTSLPAGLYLLRVSVGNQVYRRRIEKH
ncbi:YCF48-related protein [Hymenobacter nivis]|uniref:T9SS C-terminal target domain-containing protein n=1 Tax=Hymenobacter nivis TaxID=1850093 RepID=A0A502GFL9_9BACT|nr:YCF48-related protein [Hymenobacter nivis]TPG59493.1 T9SS C-terminal target domain-containing protein [Hymenobacter nivis]